MQQLKACIATYPNTRNLVFYYETNHSMNRHFYLFGIFFTALNFLAGLFNGVIYFLFRERSSMLQSSAGWFVVVSIIAFIGSIILLRYYHYKKYWLTFSAGVLCILASLCYFTAVCTFLITREQVSFASAAYLTVLVTSLLYAVSLIFSNAGKRPWLKAAGVFIFITGLILISIFTWLKNTYNVQTKFELTRVFQWTSITGSLLFVLVIMNYINELRLLKPENANTHRQKYLHGLMVLTGIAALVSTLVWGSKLAIESQPNTVTESAKRLAEPFEARTYVSKSGNTLRYRLMKPIDYDSKKKYPLVLCLHHGGTHGTDNIIQIDGSGAAQLLSSSWNRSTYPAFIFVPQCPQMHTWADIGESVFETIQSLESAYTVDPKRIYVTGASGGGYGSWYFICAHPKMFAAAIPVCGAGDTSLAKNIIDIPVWAFQGEQDNLVPARLSREMIAAIRKAGGHPRYTEFPGEGHNIWDHVSQTWGLLDWLFAQERNN